MKVREIEVVFGDMKGEIRDCNLFVFNIFARTLLKNGAGIEKFAYICKFFVV